MARSADYLKVEPSHEGTAELYGVGKREWDRQLRRAEPEAKAIRKRHTDRLILQEIRAARRGRRDPPRST